VSAVTITFIIIIKVKGLTCISRVLFVLSQIVRKGSEENYESEPYNYFPPFPQTKNKSQKRVSSD